MAKNDHYDLHFDIWTLGLVVITLNTSEINRTVAYKAIYVFPLKIPAHLTI